MDNFSGILERSGRLLERGSFREAFELIVDVPVTRPDELFSKIALLNDAGVALRDISILEYAYYLLDQHSANLLAVSSIVPYYWLNKGNLASNILALKEVENGRRCYYERSLSAEGRRAYQKAFESSGDKNEKIPLKVKILTAHAELLLGLGRELEAFELFHKAAQLDPENKRAAAGRTFSLISISGSAPYLEKILISESLQYFSESEEDEFFDDYFSLLPDPLKKKSFQKCSYPKNTIATSTEQEHTMIVYSLKNKLYLSPCSYCRKCDRAVGDSFSIGASHAAVSGKLQNFYREASVLTGRISERYRALRYALIEFYRESDFPDGSYFSENSPESSDWEPLIPSASALINNLGGSRALTEGLHKCISLFLNTENADYGTPREPGNDFVSSNNPLLHAFWDLWMDGIEESENLPGIPDKYNKIDFLYNTDKLEEETVKYLKWIKNLFGYLILTADYEVNRKKDPPLWPLQPFIPDS